MESFSLNAVCCQKQNSGNLSWSLTLTIMKIVWEGIYVEAVGGTAYWAECRRGYELVIRWLGARQDVVECLVCTIIIIFATFKWVRERETKIAIALRNCSETFRVGWHGKEPVLVIVVGIVVAVKRTILDSLGRRKSGCQVRAWTGSEVYFVPVTWIVQLIVESLTEEFLNVSLKKAVCIVRNY